MEKITNSVLLPPLFKNVTIDIITTIDDKTMPMKMLLLYPIISTLINHNRTLFISISFLSFQLSSVPPHFIPSGWKKKLAENSCRYIQPCLIVEHIPNEHSASMSTNRLSHFSRWHSILYETEIVNELATTVENAQA